MAKAKYKDWLTPEALRRLEGWKRNGLTDEQIAHNIGIRRETLWDWQKRFPNIANALKRGREDINFIVENALLQKALKGNVTAMIFFLKNNWRDKYNDSQLSPEEREQAKARTRKLKADTRISEARAEALEKLSDVSDEKLDMLLDKLAEEGQKDELGEHSDKETKPSSS